MKNNLQNNKAIEKKIDWQSIKKELREKLGNDIFESWIKKIELVEEFHNYILFSVSTRFIRDWIVSRSVSYTHLRAHETSLHLVCRLLLEKKVFKKFNHKFIQS